MNVEVEHFMITFTQQYGVFKYAIEAREAVPLVSACRQFRSYQLTAPYFSKVYKAQLRSRGINLT